MKNLIANRHIGMIVGVAFALCMTLAFQPSGRLEVRAEEAFGYYDEAGNWVSDESWDEAGTAEEETEDASSWEGGMDSTEAAAEPLTGTYSMGTGWSVDDYASTQDKTVYKQDALLGTENTSTITCSYMDTNYSVFEYEQLRDMLSNNLLYSNVNAQISASAVYTKAKDYLYILIVDDSAKDYRDLYYYVVGDYRCFCVEVREYRAEAEQAKAQAQKTPQEMGQSVAEEFIWNI